MKQPEPLDPRVLIPPEQRSARFGLRLGFALGVVLRILRTAIELPVALLVGLSIGASARALSILWIANTVERLGGAHFIRFIDRFIQKCTDIRVNGPPQAPPPSVFTGPIPLSDNCTTEELMRWLAECRRLDELNELRLAQWKAALLESEQYEDGWPFLARIWRETRAKEGPSCSPR